MSSSRSPLTEGVPPHLGAFFALRGPPVLAVLVRRAGGPFAASRAMRIAPLTLSRWMYGRSPSFSGSWPGYSSPLPGLDRLVEQVRGPGASYMGELIVRLGLVRALLRFQSGTACLDDLGITPADVRRKPVRREVPASTCRRLFGVARYPESWVALDRLVIAAGGSESWFETVLALDLRQVVHPVPPAGLACFVRVMLDGSALAR